jgi:triacylglycerol esterase/lipase EstA (alpha/beta hydrolase family)
MLNRLILAQLFAELSLYAGAGAWLHSRQGWSLAALAGAILATALAARLSIVAISTTISYLFRSPRRPEQRIGPLGGVALVLGECRALLADNLWYLPFQAIAVRPDPAPSRSGPVPVLLVHGYLSNRGMMHALIRAAEDAGAMQLFTHNFNGVFVPIETLVDQLDAQVRAVLEATGAERLVLVCHSMGGLIARAWMAKYGARSVARLVTIASPHNGTLLAALGRGANARQMRRGSDFLRALQACEGERGPLCDATSIYSVHDNLVVPQHTSRLPWAKNVELHGWAHVQILNVAPLHLLVAEELRQAGALAAR